MKICPKCNSEHEKSGTFCSRSCANSRVHSEETKKKTSNALKGRQGCRPPDFNYDAWRDKVRQTKLNKYLATSFDDLGMENRRRRVFEEQNHSCAKCGLSRWLDQPIALELEHKDGNNQNNSRDNLEGLCPNCHSLTETWRGRNKPARNGGKQISDEDLLVHLHKSKNIRQGLLSAGLAAKGNNYERAKALLENTI